MDEDKARLSLERKKEAAARESFDKLSQQSSSGANRKPIEYKTGDNSLVQIDITLSAKKKNGPAYNIKVKKEKKVKGGLQEYTVKLHKQSQYKIKLKLSAASDFVLNGVEELKLESMKAKIVAQPSPNDSNMIVADFDWTVPGNAHTTPDGVRHQCPIEITFSISRRSSNETKSVKVKTTMQAKIYNGEISSLHTGQNLNALLFTANFMTGETIGNLAYSWSP